MSLEQEVKDLSSAIKGLTEQLVIHNELLRGQTPKVLVSTGNVQAQPTEEILDDRGLPPREPAKAPEKPKRVRKKKEVVEEPDFSEEQLKELAEEELKHLEEEGEDTLPAAPDSLPQKVDNISTVQLTIEDALGALKAYLAKHKDYQSSLKLLKQFGVESLHDLKSTDYAAFIELAGKGKIEDVLLKAKK